MLNSSRWEDLWNAAQPRLSAIRDAFNNTSPSPQPRVIRVGQLDSELLDQELVQVLQEPLSRALSLVDASLKARLDPELALLLQLTLYKLSIWNTGASYGAKLQDLRYTVPPSQGRTLSPSGLPRRILLLHGTLTVILPYLHTKLRSHALSSAWPDAPSSDRRRKAWDLLTSLESSYTMLSLASFLVFLWNGRYRTIADRLLNMKLVPTRRLVKRDVSYEFMNRQMVWHAFTEFLLFLLPLVNARSIRRRISRMISYMSPFSILSSLSARPGASSSKNIAPQTRGKYWSLPQDQCAICAENATLNLNLSEPSNAFTTLTTAPIEETSVGSDTEPPAYPIYNPYLASCGDIYCYHCIAERLIQSADSGEDDGWACLRCNACVKSADRYTVEIGSDATGSDYEFTSISGSASMGSYSESGWSDSSTH